MLLRRIAGLDRATVEKWKTALAQSGTEAIWSLIQQEQLFDGDKLQVASLDQVIDHVSKKKAEADEDARRRTEAEEAKKLALEEAARSKLESAKWRTWVSSDGKHRTEAKFVRFINGVVTLEKKGGKEVKVPIDKLIKDDQDFIRQRKWLK